ncbi:MAG: GNAT family N-acetyltransferase [Jaaginema sp. PMC 1079.18]|nr:GNAT family N-acetyltransferase [Jaaginema sp. PMC 1080.18]MEC4850774.1 GNAT family N-acetyltransferase [Jaaginema sp. PMC 1079.18]MEC4867000.1 GNAT family N-acetyltransferase [Jaaginema sp. PMC 1078.18]
MKNLSTYQNFNIRSWEERDRAAAAHLIRDVLLEYNLPWQPETADRDVIEIETSYLLAGGEFWVVEQDNQIVGTAAYYPIPRGHKAVEIRKMYLAPAVRSQGLGKYLLNALETTIQQRGFQEIWIETASVLIEAVQLYEKSGYQPATGVETARCDRVYVKYLTS